jgi:hypothetical protein
MISTQRRTAQGPAKTPMPERATAKCEDCTWELPVGTYAPHHRGQAHVNVYHGHKVIITVSSYLRVSR